MPKLSLTIGIILTLIGLVGYFMSGMASITAAIPAFFGIPMALFGLVAGMNEGLRKHLMHASVLVALLGFIGMTAELIRRSDNLAMNPAIISMIVTGLLCLIFVILAVRSFIAARSADQ
ncbi:MAG: hypothetical protein KF881_05610 [Acidobacteria bacterium]|nr:hypothetical protein [Acidobacteriota bacterium]